MAAKAKIVARTGALAPCGNILLYSGVDVRAYFSKPGVVAPDYDAKKLRFVARRTSNAGWQRCQELPLFAWCRR